MQNVVQYIHKFFKYRINTMTQILARIRERESKNTFAGFYKLFNYFQKASFLAMLFACKNFQ